MKPITLRLRFSLGIVLALVASGIPATAHAGNVVPNQGFESGRCISSTSEFSSVFCHWSTFGVSRITDHPHSGAASLGVTNCVPECQGFFAGSSTAYEACALIGPGTHAASFWYSALDPVDIVSFYAFFFPTAHCTGAFSPSGLSGGAMQDGLWHELAGNLTAPAGTQSALFNVGGETTMWCAPGFCALYAAFDDLDVEG